MKTNRTNRVKTPTPFPVAYLEFGLIGTVVIASVATSFAVSVFSMEFDQIFNLIEGVFWISIAALLIYHAAKKTEYRSILIGSSITFLLFGISEFIEINTRAWYHPWSLLTLKALCVLSLFVHFVWYLKIKRNKKKC